MNLDSTLLSLRSQLSTRRENESQIMWPTRAYVSQSGKPGTLKPSLSWFIITSSDYPGRFYLNGPTGLHRWQYPNPLGHKFVRIFISLGLKDKTALLDQRPEDRFFCPGCKTKTILTSCLLPIHFHPWDLCNFVLHNRRKIRDARDFVYGVFLFLYLSKQVVLLFDFANPQVVSAEIPQSWWGSYGFTVLVVLAFWISGFSTESNGTYGGSTWGSADMAVFPWDHPDLLTTPLAAWATDTRHLNSTRMLVHVARLSILFPSTNRHCDGYVMKWYRQKSMREVEWKKNKLTWSNVRCVSWVW